MENKDLERRLVDLRKLTYDSIHSKYYSLFINNYKFTELNYQQNDYIFRKLWANGKIACFKIKNLEGYDSLGFADFTGSKWNMYDYPVEIQLINPRGVSDKIVPSSLMKVDKDSVIGYAQRSKRSVEFIVSWYCERITSCEMLINTQMIAHKSPFLISITEENKNRIKEFMKRLMGDAPVLFLDGSEIKLFQALVSGAPYIIDKLYQQKQNYENELLTYLGIDNLGGSEKKEHLITDEVKSNNMLIKDNADNFVDSINEFADRVNKVFGMKLTLECKSEMYLAMSMNNENEDETNKENEDYEN